MTDEHRKDELREKVIRPERVDWDKMVYYPKWPVRVGLKLNNQAQKISQRYKKYLCYIEKGICSTTDIAMVEADLDRNKQSKTDGEFRKAQQSFNKPLSALAKKKVIIGLTGKEHLKKNANMTFYFFSPSGRELYDELFTHPLTAEYRKFIEPRIKEFQDKSLKPDLRLLSLMGIMKKIEFVNPDVTLLKILEI